MTGPADILEFWYSEPMNKHWFKSTSDIDELIRQRYETLWKKGLAGELHAWENDATGSLALILLFDQFPLNMYRGKPESFSSEGRSIELTLQGIERGYDQQLPQSRLVFFYLPLMHSENLEHQALSVVKFEQAGLKDNARFAVHHQNIIKQFGRFPHRNSILGRKSTQEELDYLNSKDAFKG